MHYDRPSATAWRVALRRAAHQLIDNPQVLTDPFAISLVGRDAVDEFIAREAAADEAHQILSRLLRAFVVARSRYAEDQLAIAVSQGVRQYVVLGAGLDTFALRNPFATQGLRVFEVDHPATQQWKRAQLTRFGIAIPQMLTFAPADFETQPLEEALAAAGFRNDEPAVFAMLGVAPYLTAEAFTATLHYLGTGVAGNRMIFDYAVPPETARQQAAFDALARRVAAVGEPFKLFLSDAELHRLLSENHLVPTESLSAPAINERYFQDRADGLQCGGSVGRLACIAVGERAASGQSA